MASGNAQRRASRRSTLNHSSARTFAALMGTVPVALGFGVVLVRVLPIGAPERTLLGYFMVFPVWTALSLWLFLAPSGRRAWLRLLAVAALLGAAVVAAELARGEPLIFGSAS